MYGATTTERRTMPETKGEYPWVLIFQDDDTTQVIEFPNYVYDRETGSWMIIVPQKELTVWYGEENE